MRAQTVLSLLSVVALFACGGPRPAKVEVPHTRHEDIKAQALRDAEAAGKVFTPWITAPAGTFGPHLLSTTDGFLAIWATPDGDDATRGQFYSLFTNTLSHAGAANAETTTEPTQLFPIPTGLRNFTLHKLHNSDVAVLSTRTGSPGDVLEFWIVGPQGQFLDRPRILAESDGQILWAEVRSITTGGAPSDIAIWAERHKNTADIHMARLIPGSVGPTRTILQGALAWQTASFMGQMYLAVLSRTSGTPDKNTLELFRVTSAGELAEPATVVSRDIVGGYDLDLSASSQQLFLVWSSAGRFEPQLHGATFDARGELEKRGALGLPRGEQSVVRLVPSAGSAQKQGSLPILVWEEADPGLNQKRSLLLGSPGPDLLLDPKLRLSVAGTDPLLPNFVSFGERVYGLFAASDCEKDAPCGAHNLYSLKAEPKNQAGAAALSAKLSDQLRAEGGPLAPVMAWDVGCHERLGCAALVSEGGDPTDIYLYPYAELKADEAPHVSLFDSTFLSLQTVSEVPELSRLAGVEVALADESRYLLSWLSYFDPTQPYVAPTAPAPDGRRAPVRAQLQTVSLGADRRFEVEPPDSQSISIRARSLGGLDVAHHPKKPESLILWAAIDGKEPQVFATLVDDKGKKLKQKMLTRGHGEVSDVAVSRVDTGYVVAWIKSDQGSEEVYAMHVDDQLGVRSPLTISQGAVGPTGLALKSVGDRLYVAWSDARGASQPGRSDVWLRAIDKEAKTLLTEEMQAATAEGHLHSPQLARLDTQSGAELVIGYIKSATDASDDADGLQERNWGQVQLVRWDEADGRAVSFGEHTGQGVAAFSLDCHRAQCRILAAGRRDEHTVLTVAEFGIGVPVRSVLLTELRATSPDAITPLLRGDAAFFSDLSLDQKWLLKVMQINWAALR